MVELINEEEVPEEIKIQRDSIIPMKDPNPKFGGGRILLDDMNVILRAVEEPKHKGDPPIARIALWSGRKVRTIGEACLRPGDVPVNGENGDKGYRIRKVVPANSKTGVIGWVEMDPKAIVGEALAKEPRAIRPVEKR